MAENVPCQHPDMSGWLFKWTNYLRGYEKRWFVLSNGYLSYYRNREEMARACRGTLSLQGATIHSDDSNNFVISSGETFHVKATSDRDKQRWVDALVLARDLSTVSNSEINNSTSASTLTAALTRKHETVKTCNEMVSRHGQALQDTLSKLGSSTTNPSAEYSMELEERIAIFRASTSVMIKACADYSDLAESHCGKWMVSLRNAKEQDRSVNVVDLITQPHFKTLEDKLPLRITSSDEDGQVYYDCEDVDPSPGPSNLTMDNTRVHLYSAVMSGNTNQPKPSTSCGGFTRRQRVPDRPPLPMNIWASVKNAVNNDLSKMAFPVTFSEPLSALQRLTEDFEYSHILDQASALNDPGEQLAFVAGFAMSSYSNSTNRVTKPFNPLLGETFEWDRTDDLGWKVIAEQVSHHPPISALHCEGQQWECWQEQSMITKFRGQYLQILPLGEVHLKFNTGQRYAWKKVTTNIHGIIFGKTWVDHEGELEINCHTNGFKCKISFLIPSIFGGEHYKIKGIVSDNNGQTQYHVNGGYESSVEIIKASDIMKGRRGKTVSTISPVVVWNKVDPSPDSDKYYNFTVFACQLNEMEDGIAPTDSRNRPDQRLLEEGKWDSANEIKTALEEAQRKRKGTSKESKPLWFHPYRNADTKTQIYTYKGEYWQCKNKKDWKRCPSIFTYDT